VRVGTMDNPDLLPPDIHIFTESKQSWFILPEGVAAVAQYYERENHWPAESLARLSRVAVAEPLGLNPGDQPLPQDGC